MSNDENVGYLFCLFPYISSYLMGAQKNDHICVSSWKRFFLIQFVALDSNTRKRIVLKLPKTEAYRVK
jgi:hypothetical protein